MKKIAAPILEISNLCKNDKKQKIDRLNLIMSAGESTAVLYKKDCENNIELLCDILKGVKKTDKGKVFFKSADVTGSKNSFGVLGKKTGFPKNRTVADFAAAPVVKRGLSKKMALLLIEKELPAFDLSEYGNTTFSSLPDNIAKRAELFNSYMCSHELIAVNEPFSGLSDEEKNAELDILENVKTNSKLSLLLFTGNVDLAVRFADYVMVVDSNTCSAGIIAVDRKHIDRTVTKINELYNSI